MAVKMRRARLRGTNQIVSSNQIPESGKPDLVCKECRTDIRHVNRHPRELPNGTRTWVPAYFGLKPNGQHFEGCKYAPENVVERIVADSQLGPDAEQIFHAEEKGGVDFRLHIPVEALKIVRAITEADETKACEDAFTKTRYIKSQEHLDAYLNTTNQLMQLRAMVERDEDLSEHVNVVMYGRKISWHNFFYDDTRYPNLVKVLANKPPKHPVLVLMHGIKKRAYPRKEGLPHAWSITSYKKDNDPRDEVVRWLSISIKITNHDEYESIPERASVAVLFWPQLKPGFSTSDGIEFVNISGNLHHRQQFCILQDADSED